MGYKDGRDREEDKLENERKEETSWYEEGRGERTREEARVRRKEVQGREV